jgi:hypothetical protein
MKATIDQIGDQVAVLISCEDESMHLTLPASILPDGSREGDIVTLTLERDEELTEQTRELVSSLIERMRKK